MSKKQFIENATAALAANPRKVLAGHGISGAMLSKITNRVDVMKYMCDVLFTLKTWKKPTGLKKSNLLQIKAYKNFTEMNLKARLDVEKFMAGLKGDDVTNFTNNDNIMVIAFGYHKGMVTGPEGDDIIESMIANSAIVKFDTAVRKENKFPDVSYVVIMVAPSLIRTSEEKAAERTAKKNAVRVKRDTKTAKLRKELARSKKSLVRNKRALEALRDKEFALEAQNAQYQYITAKTGDADLWTNLQNMNAQSARKAALKAEKLLNSSDAKLFKAAMTMMQQGMEDEAKLILRRIKNKAAIKAALEGTDNVAAGNDMIDARRKELAKVIRNAEAKVIALRKAYKAAIDPIEKRNLRSKYAYATRKLEQLKARMKFYAASNHSAMGGRAQQLAAVRAEIEKNIEEGRTISQALNAGLEQLRASKAVKQQVKQQIVQQVADGTPMQFAVQQAIQEMPAQAQQERMVLNKYAQQNNLTGTIEFEDLLDALEM